ncbi:MAG: hypothetical protein ACKO68_03775, partial [Bacteroidota bacterium]
GPSPTLTFLTMLPVTVESLFAVAKEPLKLPENELLTLLWDQVERDINSAGFSVPKPPSIALADQADQLLHFLEELPSHAMPGLLYRIDLPENALFSSMEGFQPLVWSILEREAMKVVLRLRYS